MRETVDTFGKVVRQAICCECHWEDIKMGDSVCVWWRHLRNVNVYLRPLVIRADFYDHRRERSLF